MSNFDAVTYSAIKALKLQGGDSTPSTGLASDVGTMVMVPANFTSEYYVDTGTKIDATKNPELATMFPSYFDGTTYGSKLVEVTAPPIQVRSKWWVGEETEKKFLTFSGAFFCFHGSMLTTSATDDFASFTEIDDDVQLLAVSGDSLLIYRPHAGTAGIYSLATGSLVKSSDVVLGFTPQLITYEDNGFFFCLSTDKKIYRSSNMTSWTAIGDLGNREKIYDVIVNGVTIIATTLTALLVSKDSGATWTEITHLSRIIGSVPSAVAATSSSSKVFWDATTSAYYTGVVGQTFINNLSASMIISKSSDGLTWTPVNYTSGGVTVTMAALSYGLVSAPRPHRWAGSIFVSMSWGYNATPYMMAVTGSTYAYLPSNSAIVTANQFMFNNATRIKGLNYDTVYHIGSTQVSNLQGRSMFWEFRKVTETDTTTITAAMMLAAKPMMPGSKQYQYVKEIGSYNGTRVAIPTTHPVGGLNEITFYKSTDNWATHQEVKHAISGNRVGEYDMIIVGSVLYLAYVYRTTNALTMLQSSNFTTFSAYMTSTTSVPLAAGLHASTFKFVNVTNYPVLITDNTAYAMKTSTSYSVLDIPRGFNTSRLSLNINEVPTTAIKVLNSASAASVSWSSGSMPSTGFTGAPIGYQINAEGDIFVHIQETTGAATTIANQRIATIVKTVASGQWALSKVVSIGPMSMPGKINKTIFYYQGNVFIGWSRGSGSAITTSDYGQTWTTTGWPMDAIVDSDLIMSSKNGIVTGAASDGYGYEIINGIPKMKLTTGGNESSVIPVVAAMAEGTKWVVKIK